MTDGRRADAADAADDTDTADAPADAAPELAADDAERAADGDRSGGEATGDATAGPLPRVPDSGGGDDEPSVPPTSGGRDGHGGRNDRAAPDQSAGKPIRFYRATDGDRAGTDPDGRGDADGAGADACGCGGGCGCGGERDGARSTAAKRAADASGGGERTLTPDGGARPTNVDADGNLTDLSFTEPSAGKSQDVETDAPDERVGVPEGVDLDTPGYGIRAQMNDIDTPDDKTWFMELDEAVIDEGRCIQCGTCVASCPSDSIGIGDDGLPELVKMCTGCSLCWDFCPRGGLRYERQWKITGGDDNVKGAGDPITEFSARVGESWQRNAQDGGVVTGLLSHLLDAGEIDGALIATESDDEPWKAESFLATSHAELVANAGSFYNQTMALGNLDLERWAHKIDGPVEEASLALVGTPCEIEGIRALQDFEWEYGSQEEGVRAIDYTIALMCTKNFNHQRLIGEQLEEKRDIPPEDIGKLDVLDGKMRVYDHDHDLVLEEDVANFHDAALKGCDECADFTGYCADITVGSVGSADEFSSVIVRTEQGMKAWELTEPDLDYHDLEDRSAVGKLQGWDKKKAFDALERPFDPDAPRFIEYTEHAEWYGTELNPHETDH